MDEAADTPVHFRSIKDFVTTDITYVNNIFDYLTLSVSIFNVSDEDPLHYNHTPFGRLVKLGVVYSLEQ